jgi:hypothetical protein
VGGSSSVRNGGPSGEIIRSSVVLSAVGAMPPIVDQCVKSTPAPLYL